MAKDAQEQIARRQGLQKRVEAFPDSVLLFSVS